MIYKTGQVFRKDTFTIVQVVPEVIDVSSPSDYVFEIYLTFYVNDTEICKGRIDWYGKYAEPKYEVKRLDKCSFVSTETGDVVFKIKAKTLYGGVELSASFTLTLRLHIFFIGSNEIIYRTIDVEISGKGEVEQSVTITVPKVYKWFDLPEDAIGVTVHGLSIRHFKFIPLYMITTVYPIDTTPEGLVQIKFDHRIYWCGKIEELALGCRSNKPIQAFYPWHLSVKPCGRVIVDTLDLVELIIRNVNVEKIVEDFYMTTEDLFKDIKLVWYGKLTYTPSGNDYLFLNSWYKSIFGRFAVLKTGSADKSNKILVQCIDSCKESGTMNISLHYPLGELEVIAGAYERPQEQWTFEIRNCKEGITIVDIRPVLHIKVPVQEFIYGKTVTVVSSYCTVWKASATTSEEEARRITNELYTQYYPVFEANKDYWKSEIESRCGVKVLDMWLKKDISYSHITGRWWAFLEVCCKYEITAPITQVSSREACVQRTLDEVIERELVGPVPPVKPSWDIAFPEVETVRIEVVNFEPVTEVKIPKITRSDFKIWVENYHRNHYPDLPDLCKNEACTSKLRGVYIQSVVDEVHLSTYYWEHEATLQFGLQPWPGYGHTHEYDRKIKVRPAQPIALLIWYPDNLKAFECAEVFTAPKSINPIVYQYFKFDKDAWRRLRKFCEHCIPSGVEIEVDDLTREMTEVDTECYLVSTSTYLPHVLNPPPVHKPALVIKSKHYRVGTGCVEGTESTWVIPFELDNIFDISSPEEVKVPAGDLYEVNVEVEVSKLGSNPIVNYVLAELWTKGWSEKLGENITFIRDLEPRYALGKVKLNVKAKVRIPEDTYLNLRLITGVAIPEYPGDFEPSHKWGDEYIGKLWNKSIIKLVPDKSLTTPPKILDPDFWILWGVYEWGEYGKEYTASVGDRIAFLFTGKTDKPLPFKDPRGPNWNQCLRFRVVTEDGKILIDWVEKCYGYTNEPYEFKETFEYIVNLRPGTYKIYLELIDFENSKKISPKVKKLGPVTLHVVEKPFKTYITLEKTKIIRGETVKTKIIIGE